MILHQARNGVSSAREIRFSISNSPHTSSPFSTATFLYSRDGKFSSEAQAENCLYRTLQKISQ
jgi:hypothetical protein